MNAADRLRTLREAASGGPSRVEPMRGEPTFFNMGSTPSHYNVFRHSPDDEDRRVGEITFTPSGIRAKEDAILAAVLLDACSQIEALAEAAQLAIQNGQHRSGCDQPSGVCCCGRTGLVNALTNLEEALS